jgi:hypothetical protein
MGPIYTTHMSGMNVDALRGTLVTKGGLRGIEGSLNSNFFDIV